MAHKYEVWRNEPEYQGRGVDFKGRAYAVVMIEPPHNPICFDRADNIDEATALAEKHESLDKVVEWMEDKIAAHESLIIAEAMVKFGVSKRIAQEAFNEVDKT